MSANEKMLKVQVLLSTYNGKLFLKEQLDSLRSQNGVVVEVLARDDGSTDGTREYLLNYATEWPALKVLDGHQNLGVVKSFFELLRLADESSDYFAFCDQDDVWQFDKLMVATQKLGKKENLPSLYFSRLQYVDEKLRPIGLSSIPVHVMFSSALVENVATGCSLVFNCKLLLLMRTKFPTKNCLMHDWWAYLCALAMGEVVYDDQPRVMYRQHASNVVGASASWLQIYATKWKRFWHRPQGTPTISDQVAEFLGIFGDQVSPDKRKLMADFVNSRNKGVFFRFCYALSMPLRRQSRLDNVLFRVLILLGRY